MNNVFIKEERSIAYGNGEFYVVLPGCTATIEKLGNGEFKLLHMTADDSYFNLQKSGQRPGLYRAKHENNIWDTKFIGTSVVQNKEDRVVAITDRGIGKPEKTAEEAAPYISSSPVSGGEFTIKKNGFDMHYTPGDARIGGLKSARKAMMAESDPELHESALLLAKTMFDAKDIEGVRWISERGGSGVLTQAMKILVDQGIKLEKHAVFLSHPTTRQSRAIDLGLQLGLQLDRKHSKNNPLRADELIGGLGFGGGFITAYNRLNNDKKYDGWKFIGDVVTESKSLKAAGATAATVGVSLGVASGAVSMPALITFAGAVVGAVGLGSKLTEAYLPRLHNKIKSKF